MKPFDKCPDNKIVFLICLLLLICMNLSLTWPVENERITSTFGESRGDHFHNGIDMISGKSAIYPADDGELVFLWDNSLFPAENYPGPGNFRILEHNAGYYSIYMHLTDNPKFKNSYTKNDPIGEIGDTGHSSGKHLHLSIYHIKSKRFINPLTVFPKIADKIKPNIEDAYIRIEDTYFRIRNNEKIKLTQHYPLLVNVWDSINKGDRLGIYKLVIILNGEKAADNDYSEIVLSQNGLTGLTISGKSFQELFDEKGCYKASKVKYADGINKLSITAVDYSGNESSKEVSFTVNLDMQ